MRAVIRYWTGTGNTARAAGLIASTLVEAGWSVDASEVRWDSPVPTPEELEVDLVVVGCPTLGFGAPAHFLGWLRRWPRATGGQAMVLAVGGATPGRDHPVPGFTALVPWQVSGLLKRRGFSVGTLDAFYPVNWTQVLEPPGVVDCALLRADADPQVVQWARHLAAGRPLPAARVTFARAAAFPLAWLYRLVGRRFLGKLFVADRACTGCGLCARRCPSGVISMSAGRPRWNLACDACNRCINECPATAIQVSLVRALVLGVGNLGLLGASLAVPGGWLGVGLFLGGTLVQLTLLDGLLFRLESKDTLKPAMTWGWTKGRRRYR